MSWLVHKRQEARSPSLDHVSKSSWSSTTVKQQNFHVDVQMLQVTGILVLRKICGFFLLWLAEIGKRWLVVIWDHFQEKEHS